MSRINDANMIIFAHKLEVIKQYIDNRIDFVGDLTKNEFKFILNILSRYEEVPKEWKLDNLSIRRKLSDLNIKEETNND